MDGIRTGMVHMLAARVFAGGGLTWPSDYHTVDQSDIKRP